MQVVSNLVRCASIEGFFHISETAYMLYYVYLNIILAQSGLTSIYRMSTASQNLK